jgi:hypothetical protein
MLTACVEMNVLVSCAACSPVKQQLFDAGYAQSRIYLSVCRSTDIPRALDIRRVVHTWLIPYIVRVGVFSPARLPHEPRLAQVHSPARAPRSLY